MGCRRTTDKGDLIRIVRTPEGTVTADLTGRMNGRGAYLCRNEECLKKAVKAGTLQKALKCRIPDEVTESIAQEIRR